jgi:hypothetical protein
VRDGKDLVSSQLLQFSDGHHTFNMYKTSQGSIVTKKFIKQLKQVIDFCEVRVYNYDIFTDLSRSYNRE